VYRVEYYCPRQSQFWQPLKGFLGLFPQTFATQEQAVQACNPLLWQYHSARVIDPWGNVVYQV
jgi:hypothetical protein